MTAARQRFQPFADLPHLERVTIHVGQIYASRQAVVVQTLLGSCVSVCLLDPKSGIGGMNHILLPGKADLRKFDESARYGVNAMELLINKVVKLGASRQRLAAKVFGGANIINGLGGPNNPGYRNEVFVREFLELEKIPVLGKDLGGENARRIYLRTDTGEVYMRRIPRYDASIVVVEERQFHEKISREITKTGGVTLFRTPGPQSSKS